MSKKSLSCGIVGLPNVGKSTLFKALTGKAAPIANYPFCTIDPNIGIVELPDPRLQTLATLSHSKKIIPATVTFVDIAGLVKGASKGEGLGNQFLANIRETDVIIHMVRSFEETDVIHVSGQLNPLEDIEVIQIELILADLQMAENIKRKIEKQAKGNKELLSLLATLETAISHLNNGHPLRTLLPSQRDLLKPYRFLTSKKVIYVVNMSEPPFSLEEEENLQKIKKYARQEGNFTVPICAKLEQELASLSPGEACEYLLSLGLEGSSALNRLIRSAFEALDLITFLTTGEMETRAWAIQRGTEAQEAAGEIHSDIQKGFIRAEVIAYEDVITYHGRLGAKEAGKVRFEGREYLIQDGDVVLFHHQ